MANLITQFFGRLFGRPPRPLPGATLETTESAERYVSAPTNGQHQELAAVIIHDSVLPFDENLLERARTQWQLGDWESLSQMNRDALTHHPDRAKLALLAASGHQQRGDTTSARQFVELARNWDCDQQLIGRVLVAGVFNTLGNVQMARGNDSAGLARYEEAIRLVQPHADSHLYGESRAVREAAKMGLLPQASQLMGEQLKMIKTRGSTTDAEIRILQTEIELLQGELSLAQQRQQLPLQGRGRVTERISGRQENAELSRKSMSQLGQDLWVLEKTNYKNNGFFVEFGATDGVLLSNTWLLEKEFEWKGICAEPNPKFFEKLKHNRECVVSCDCIGRETGIEIEFILADAYGGNKNFMASDQHFEKRKAYLDAGHATRLIAISLNDLLIKYDAPRDIDYISIDTEGSEYDILSEFPFDRWNVRLFTIEHNFTGQRAEIFSLMAKNGYIRTEREWDDWYEKM